MNDAKHRPSSASRVMGVLFCIGSFCFALGSLPLYFEHVPPTLTASTFFVGSIFFTSASYVQWHETLPRQEGADAAEPTGRWRWRPLIGWRPRSIDWWATIVQLVGTVEFNISTFNATRTDLTLEEERQLIWAPDVYGSTCFLVASVLAQISAGRVRRSRPDGPLGWTIATLNTAGSVAFGFAAIAGRYLTTTGEVANIRIVNLGTFLGAVCFFVGAALLPKQSSQS